MPQMVAQPGAEKARFSFGWVDKGWGRGRILKHAALHTDRWYLRIGGNFGGWGVDNVDSTYELGVAAAYRFKMWGASTQAFFGYRYLHIEHEEDLNLHVDIKGPIIGIGWQL